MKIKELVENYKSFADPDYAPGAMEREGDARAALYDRQKEAVVALNKFAKKFGLGCEFEVGQYVAFAGEFIKVNSTRKKDATLKGTEIIISNIEVDPRDNNFRIWLDCPLPNKDEVNRLNANAKIDLDLYTDNFIGKSRYANDVPTMISFGAATTNFSNAQRVKKAEAIFSMLIQVLNK